MNLKAKKQNILFCIFLSLSFFSCKPEQPSTDFNVLIDVPNGEDVRLETKEDEDLIVEYSVDPFEESIDLKLLIQKKPKYGTLKDCEQVSPFSIRCVYVPKKNFSGVDEIIFVTKDGDLKGDNASKVMIDVTASPDIPIARDGSFNAQSAKQKIFQFPDAIDPDSSKNELMYEIVTWPEHGTLYDCHLDKCKYKSESMYEGDDYITYRVVDQTDLSSNVARMNISVSMKKNKGIETFTQGVNSLHGVDIVWVIDNSGSMQDEQESLAKNFQSFIENFMNNGKAKFPFNMGVITTDKYLSSGPSVLEEDRFGVPYNLTSSRAESDFINFKKDFEIAVNVGINGSGTEKSYDSIKALNTKNKNWFADDNHMLVYIILSDEAEQSSNPISNWNKYFLSLKSESYKIKVFPIINKSVDDEKRYSQVASATKTKLYDIDSSFDQVLDDISLNVSQNLSQFKLKEGINIISKSIKVKIDGQEVTNFVFENNTIKLMQAPPAYATIVVTYEYGGY